MMTNATATDYHLTLATLWALYNNQRGTDKQLARIVRQLSVSDLQRMLTERNIAIWQVPS